MENLDSLMWYGNTMYFEKEEGLLDQKNHKQKVSVFI